VPYGYGVYEPKDGAVPHGCDVYEPKDGEITKWLDSIVLYPLGDKFYDYK